tara:strand:- start:532 stop:1191 length:660 start_codon:yes stop_codon:yes gene_type:complete
MINRKIEAMLFDFDGTLADTSEDMVNCLNILLKNHGKKDVRLSEAKNFISKGAGGLIDFSCPKLSKSERKTYIKEYLEIYKNNLFIRTHLFDGIKDIIENLTLKNIKWGIVTNKPSYLVNPIVEMLNFYHKPSCIVAGDTLSVKKPNPEPLIYAAKLIKCEPIFCAYVGDDIRDITAANKAGMLSVAAMYGFIKDPNEVIEWGCDYTINTPSDLKNLII